MIMLYPRLLLFLLFISFSNQMVAQKTDAASPSKVEDRKTEVIKSLEDKKKTAQ